MKHLLLSIHPKHLSKIMDGSKTIELRKQSPRIECCKSILLYSTSPQKALIGIAKLSMLVVAKPLRFWMLMGIDTGVTKGEYDEYFKGKNWAVGLCLEMVERIDPIGLEELRRVWGQRFSPPQGFHYIEQGKLDKLEIKKR